MSLINDIVNTVTGGQPNAPIAQVEQAIEATKANPNSDQIIADIKTALDLFIAFKTSMNSLHPTVWSVIKFLL